MIPVLKLISMLIALTLLASCNHNTTKEQHGHHHDIHKADDKLSLNHGKKWSANPETTNGIDNMKELINNFSGPETPQAYIELKEKLESEFHLIFKNCTMTGEAHNQLHHYLMPVKDKISRLESPEIKIQKESLYKLKEHLAEYSNYFE